MPSLGEAEFECVWSEVAGNSAVAMSLVVDGVTVRQWGSAPAVWCCHGTTQGWAGARYLSWSDENQADGWQADDSLLISALMSHFPGLHWLNLEPKDSLVSTAALAAGAAQVINVSAERWVLNHLKRVHKHLRHGQERMLCIEQPMAQCWSRIPKDIDVEGAIVRCYEGQGDVQRQASLALRRLEPVLVPGGILALWGADESLPLPNLKRLLKREGPDFVYLDHSQQQGDFAVTLQYDP
ncbi:hypothetical protein [Pokkaliibacter sp. CJK22405]|uniref:hypothetical protein n=1 Tax=Pokkaliibacter sp. CJK22405 TaxID=3384615 RepID=UPI0039852C15